MRQIVTAFSPATRLGLRSLLPLGLLAALAVAAAAGVALLVWEPAQTRFSAAEALYAAARHDQGRQKAARKALEDLAGVWDGLLVRTEFPTLILAISELAQQDRIAIPGMTYALEKVEHEQVLKASMTFRAAGGYPAIRRFLYRVETMNSYIVIESLSATRGKEAHEVEFSVRAVTFLRPDQTSGPRPTPDSGDKDA